MAKQQKAKHQSPSFNDSLGIAKYVSNSDKTITNDATIATPPTKKGKKPQPQRRSRSH